MGGDEDRARPTAPSRAGLRVLFVCTANVCRSPLAAGLMRLESHRRSAPISVASAGFMPPGLPSDPHVVDILAARDVDMSHKQSRILGAGVVDKADLILGMTTRHVRDILASHPQVQRRAFTLRHFAKDAAHRPAAQSVSRWVDDFAANHVDAALYLFDGTDVDIADPIGEPRPVFDALAEEMQRMVGWIASCANLDEQLAPAHANSPNG